MRIVFLLLALCSYAPRAAAQLIHDVIDADVVLAPPVRTGGGPAETRYTSAFIAQPFTGIAVQGTTSDRDVQGWVRFEDTTGWSAWQPLYVVFSVTGDAFLGAYRGTEARAGTRFELRFHLSAGAQVEITAAGVFDARRDTVEPPLPGETGAGLGKNPSSAITPPFLHTRQRWNAAPFKGTAEPLAPRGYVRMSFHHAAGFGASTLADGLAQVRAIQDFHQNGRGWSDIGYQFVMDQSGRIYQGRPFLDAAVSLSQVPALAMGAHVGGANTGNIGVCVLGCYHPSEPGGSCTDVLSPAARDSLVTMLAFLGDVYEVPAAQLMGHRDQGATSCPGDNNYALLPGIRDAVIALQQAGSTPLPTGFELSALVTPHPVRDRATLRYFLLSDGLVSLRIYDSLGREVATLVDGVYLEGEQWHEAFLDAQPLASGTYFYRLSVEGFSSILFDDTRALVVVR